jgi:hypothetical protein
LVNTGKSKAKPEASAMTSNIQLSMRKFTNQTFKGKKTKARSKANQLGF